MKRPGKRTLRWLRPIGGVAILAIVIWRVGTGPFVTGLRSITIWPVVAAAGITCVSAVCAAWRWRLVARGLGVGITMPAAVSAYYRSLFVNTVLPGGVLGDVDRAMRQGRAAGDVRLGLRAVAWERAVGQLVQLALTFLVLLTFPSSVHAALPIVATVLAVALCIVAALHLGGARLRLTSKRAWLEVGVASVIAVGCYASIFLIAAHSAGSTTSFARMLPLAMIVLLATALPTSIGGWGPREGVAAWLFAAAGLGANQGIATATVYGVMVFASCLPGGALLAVALVRGRRADHRAATEQPAEQPADRRSRTFCSTYPDPWLSRPEGSGASVPNRPYTLLSCGMSIDGYLDSPTVTRLPLSNDTDFDRVDAVRASCDAVLVGAATVRNDNPRLVVRSQSRRDERLARGLQSSPTKVTITCGGELDPAAQFFANGDTEKVVYCASPSVGRTRDRLASVATVVDGGQPVQMEGVAEDLYARGVRRLMVEGGGTIHTQVPHG